MGKDKKQSELRRYFHGMIVMSDPSDDPDSDGWAHEMWTCEPVEGKPGSDDVAGRDKEGKDRYFRPVEKVGDFKTLALAVNAAKSASKKAANLEIPSEDDTQVFVEPS